MFGPVYFLSGDGYPIDIHVDRELRQRLSPSFERWTGQKDIHDPTPGSFQMHEFDRRAAHFETFLANQGAGSNTVLMGRSSGARLATRYASQHQVAAVICLAYPFRKPSTEREPERYQHLADLAVPTLMCQGFRDEYGGSSIFNEYSFSPSTRIHMLNTRHDFAITSDAWDRIARIILEFCQEVLPRP